MPVTIALDTTWRGTGAIDRTHSRFVSGGPDDLTLSFNNGASRAAILSGTVTLDGAAVAVSDISGARLFREITGELVIIR